MNDEGLTAGVRNLVDEPVEARLCVLIVDADAAFHRDRQARRLCHLGHALRDPSRVRHETCAEPAGLHAVRRAADIQVDLVVALLGADSCSLRELQWIAAAELQRDRMLLGIEPEDAFAIAVNHGLGRHHLGVEQRALRDEPHEVAAVAVGPLHHRGDAEFMA